MLAHLTGTSMGTCDAEHLFTCLLTMCVLFGEMSVQVLCPFFNSVIYLLIVEFFFKKMFYLFLDRGEGREDERETSVCGCRLHTPFWGPGLQPRHVP